MRSISPSAPIVGLLAHNADSGAADGALPVVAPVAPVPVKARKPKVVKAKVADDNPYAYHAPKIVAEAGFTIHYNAFDGIASLVTLKEAAKERGETNCRPGWTRSLWIDVEERAGRPVVIVRCADIAKRGASDKPEADVEEIYNDETGAPRPPDSCDVS